LASDAAIAALVSRISFSARVWGTVVMIVSASGDAYVTSNNGGTWVFSGNLFSGTTPALHESWGSLKSRYAPSHAPTSQTPTNR